MQDWVSGEISESRQRIANLNQEMTAIGEDPLSVKDAVVQLELLKTRRKAEEAGLQSSLKLQPYINDYLPKSPFQTVVLLLFLCVLRTSLQKKKC